MTRRWVLAGLLTLAALPAHAAPTVALMPAPVIKGAAANGKIVTQALQNALNAKGFTNVPAGKVNAAIGAAHVDMKMPIAVATLAKIRTATGADYLIYPRVLSVGTGLASGHFQATVIVNVVGKSSSSFFFTRQVAQEFPSTETDRGRAVIDPTSADAGASKLLEGFFAKAK